MTPAPTGDPAAITLFFGIRAWDGFKQMSGQSGTAGSDDSLMDWLERSLQTEARFIKTSAVVTLITGGIALECQSSPAIDENGRGVVLSVDSVFRPLPSVLELAAVFALPDGLVWKIQLEGNDSGLRFGSFLGESAASTEPPAPPRDMFHEFLGGKDSGSAMAAGSGPLLAASPVLSTSFQEARRPVSRQDSITESAFAERTRWLRALAPGLSFGECALHELAKALSDWSTGLGKSGSFLVCVLSSASLHGIRAMLGQVDPPAFTGEGRELWEALREAEALRQHLTWPAEYETRFAAESERVSAAIFRLDIVERLYEQSREISAALQKAKAQKSTLRLPMTPAMAAWQWRLSRRLSNVLSREQQLSSAQHDRSFGERTAREKASAEKLAKAMDALIASAGEYASRYGASTFEADASRLSAALERLNSDLAGHDPLGEYRNVAPEQITFRKAQLQSELERAKGCLLAWQAWQKIRVAPGASALLRCFRMPHLFLVEREIEGVWDLLAAARPGIIVAESIDAAPASLSAEIAILLQGNGLKPVAGTTAESDEALGELRRALISWRPSDEEISAVFPGLSAVHGRALLLNLTGRG